MLPSAGHRLLSLIVLCLLIAAPVTGQWSRPTFDAAIAYFGNNSQSMIELLDMNGTGGVDALAVRIDVGTSISYVGIKVLDFNTGWILSTFTSIPSVGTMAPAGGVEASKPSGRDRRQRTPSPHDFSAAAPVAIRTSRRMEEWSLVSWPA